MRQERRDRLGASKAQIDSDAIWVCLNKKENWYTDDACERAQKQQKTCTSREGKLYTVHVQGKLI